MITNQVISGAERGLRSIVDNMLVSNGDGLLIATDGRFEYNELIETGDSLLYAKMLSALATEQGAVTMFHGDASDKLKLTSIFRTIALGTCRYVYISTEDGVNQSKIPVLEISREENIPILMLNGIDATVLSQIPDPNDKIGDIIENRVKAVARATFGADEWYFIQDDSVVMVPSHTKAGISQFGQAPEDRTQPTMYPAGFLYQDALVGAEGKIKISSPFDSRIPPHRGDLYLEFDSAEARILPEHTDLEFELTKATVDLNLLGFSIGLNPNVRNPSRIASARASKGVVFYIGDIDDPLNAFQLYAEVDGMWAESTQVMREGRYCLPELLLCHE